MDGQGLGGLNSVSIFLKSANLKNNSMELECLPMTLWSIEGFVKWGGGGERGKSIIFSYIIINRVFIINRAFRYKVCVLAYLVA